MGKKQKDFSEIIKTKYLIPLLGVVDIISPSASLFIHFTYVYCTISHAMVAMVANTKITNNTPTGCSHFSGKAIVFGVFIISNSLNHY